MAGQLRIGARPPDYAEADAGGRGGVTAPDGSGAVVSQPIVGLPGGDQAAEPGHGADGTLLAVVPIPGTGTSLAIVGYPVPMPGGGIATGAVPASAVTVLARSAARPPRCPH